MYLTPPVCECCGSSQVQQADCCYSTVISLLAVDSHWQLSRRLLWLLLRRPAALAQWELTLAAGESGLYQPGPGTQSSPGPSTGWNLGDSRDKKRIITMADEKEHFSCCF